MTTDPPAGQPADRTEPAPGAGPGPWTGPALLVPMNVEALVITDDAYKAAWSFAPPAYSRLADMVSPDAAPFSPNPPQVPGDPKFRGVLLHWALPDGVTSGAQSGTGVSYPAVPNRWLVVGRAALDGEWLDRAWIVASDVLGGRAGGPWPPSEPGGRPSTLGASWPIEQWPGEAAIAADLLHPPLTAVGPGDPAYAAFVPNVPNGFTYADSFAAPLDRRAGPLAYTVLGWYSRPQLDPLYGAAQYGPDGWRTPGQWRDLTARLGWSVGDDAALEQAELAARAWALARGLPVDGDPHLRLPARTLCHGTVQGIAWEGPSGRYVSGAPTTNPQRPSYIRPRIAIAHSNADALASMIAEDERERGAGPRRIEELVKILAAFQLDLLPALDAADGGARLAMELQRDWFGTAAGGTAWEVLAPRDAAAPGGDPVPPPLTEVQRRLLDALNTAQAQFDRRTWSLESLQWDLFALWWKGSRLTQWFPPPEKEPQWTAAVERATAVLKPQVAQAIEEYAQLRGRRDAAEAALRETLADLELRADANPPFQAPSEPVLMVSGVRRSSRHGRDGRFAEDGTLRCRFTGQTISGLIVPVGDRRVPVTGADLPPPVWSAAEQPRETTDLLLESAMLDLDFAPRIATVAAAKAGSADPWSLLAAIRTEQTLLWNTALHPALDHEAVAAAGAFVYDPGPGAAPSKIAVSLHRPPWSPLYLDWAFDYYPGSARQDSVLEPWELPGADSEPLDEFSYRWRGPGIPDRKNAQRISGRAVLAAQATDVLAERLQRLIEDHADAPEVQDNLWALTDALTFLHNADLLSQAASGFNAALIERAEETFLAPDDRLLDPADGPTLLPDTPPRPPVTVVPNPFQPIRAGHVRIVRLWIVDAFGQAFKVIDPQGGALSPLEPPLRGTDLRTRGDELLAELKPRVTQPIRIALDLLPAEPGAVGADATATRIGAIAESDRSPVCGWITASPLDNGLLVHDADGVLEGVVLDAQDRAIWSGAPDRTVPAHGSPSPERIRNIHLRRMITGLLANSDSAGALQALLELIETTAWGSDPSGGWTDEELPVLAGAPLCVVRATLGLGLRGLPAQDQSWDATGTGSTAGFDAVRFPVQLGSTELLDDGLVGYYLDDDYRQINTAYEVEPHGYVGSDRPTPSLDGADAPLLTLVMSPRAAVHAVSGILPVARAEIPVQYTLPALDRIEVTIRTGPVLTGPGDVSVPLPEVSRGSWSWLEHQSPDKPADFEAIQNTDTIAALPDAPPVVREGWLRLSANPGPGCFSYSASPSVVATTADPARPSAAPLQITAYNHTGGPVDCERLEFRLPVGAADGDLVDEPGGIAATPPPDGQWHIEDDGAGRFTARPLAPPVRVERGATLTFGFAGLRINAVAGRALVEIIETAEKTAEPVKTVKTAETAANHRSVGGRVSSGAVAVTKIPPTAPTQLVYTVTPRSILEQEQEQEQEHGPGVGAMADADATFRITAFNPSVAEVRCAQISLVVPVWDRPGDLVRRAQDVSASILEGADWRIESDGAGGFVLLPRSREHPARTRPQSAADAFALVPPGGRIVMELRVEGGLAPSPGTAVLAVIETAAEQAANRSTVLTIHKDAAATRS